MPGPYANGSRRNKQKKYRLNRTIVRHMRPRRRNLVAADANKLLITSSMIIENLPIDSVFPYKGNPRINDNAVDKVMASIRDFGFRQPIVVDENMEVVVGHTRLLAARKLGLKEVPVHIAKDMTPEKAQAYRIVDNKTGEIAEWDLDLLSRELEMSLANGYDMQSFGFDASELSKLLESGPSVFENTERPPLVLPGSLREKFVFPPFSVFDTRQGWWKDRKIKWKELGIKSEAGRGTEGSGLSTGGVLFKTKTSHPTFYREKTKKEKELGYALTASEFATRYFDPKDDAAAGSSIFDPVLCELFYRWFCPAGGVIGDPFAGGSVRGIVASELGRNYVGMDLREEQIDANIENFNQIYGPRMAREVGGKVRVRVSAAMMTLKFKGCPTDFSDSCFGNCRNVFPFELNKNGALIVSRRYRLMDCYAGGGDIPAYVKFNSALVSLFGASEVARIESIVQAPNAKDFYAEMPRDSFDFLVANGGVKQDDTVGDVKWLVGDSAMVNDFVGHEPQFDFLFSCPPYGDLEVYSDDPADISNMPYGRFVETYERIIDTWCRLLKNNRFACFVVGEYRSKATGGYMNFVGDTVRAFEKAGLTYYNEAILVNVAGSLTFRVGPMFNKSRKFGKQHQNILMFVKGSPQEAAKYIGPVDVEEIEVRDEDLEFNGVDDGSDFDQSEP